jgi:anti-anti-sigma regulatory factor
MVISNCSDGVKDILELVGITTIIPTVATEAEAIASIK